ncbi:hypothetical protein C0J52_05894 [Blattella germanica]|nr:hypothetical protein C0J52_05894 [Blattella germanica]
MPSRKRLLGAYLESVANKVAREDLSNLSEFSNSGDEFLPSDPSERENDTCESCICNEEHPPRRQTVQTNPDISDWIKISTLRWAGYLMCMKEEEIPRRMIALQLGGQRGRGRPILRWIDGVNGDAEALEMRQWKVKALDRDDIEGKSATETYNLLRQL